MKRFKETTKYVVFALAFCLLFSVSIVSEAATYKPGVTYVNPDVNSKQEYYSVLKKRMFTYSDDSVYVVYPKGATLSVKTNKKALQATITEQKYESLSNDSHYYYYYDEDDGWGYDRPAAKVYVNVTPDSAKVQTTYYYLTKDGDKWQLTQEGNRFYTYLDYNKVYLTPNRTERKVEDGYAIKVAELSDYEYYVPSDLEEREDGYYKVYDLYDDGDGKGYYYWNDDAVTLSNGMVVETPDGQADYEYSRARIQLTSTKAGTYTVSVSVNGQVQKLKVFVTTYCGDRAVSVTLNKKSLSKYSRKASDKGSTTSYVADYKVSSSLKSAKLKLKADKGIKITGMIVATVNKDGKAVYKKVKNGGKISLSQAYANKTTSTNGYFERDSKKHTYVFVSYKDKNQGTYTTYSIVNKHGVKEIKRTIKYASDSKKYVDYLDYNDGEVADVDLWSY